ASTFREGRKTPALDLMFFTHPAQWSSCSRLRLPQSTIPPEVLVMRSRSTKKDRSTTRPVHVDESGRIFDASGQLVSAPGLEPTKVSRGLDDESAGRVRPLKDIVADE
ncbi:MAG: hypothetical protein WBC80_03975, partial [Isosphaeraceae bacterium]